MKKSVLIIAFSALLTLTSCRSFFFSVREEDSSYVSSPVKPDEPKGSDGAVAYEDAETEIAPEEYYGEWGDISEQYSIDTSAKMLSEADAVRLFEVLGFDDIDIIAEYSEDGVFTDSAVISGSVSVRHPMYYALYTSASGVLWNISVVEDIILADPVYFNFARRIPVIYSPSEMFVGYDSGSKDKYTDHDWVAHRSELAWSGRVSIDSEVMCVPMSGNRNENWFFVADSGATVPDIFNKRTKNVNYEVRSSLSVLPTTKYTTVVLDPQISIFDTFDSRDLKADYVTMTMGGNDMGFADVVSEAATSGRWNPKNFTDKLNKRCEKMDSVVNDLKEAYKKISERAGRQATIIIAGYPPLMDPHGSFVFPECNSVNVDAKISLFNSKIEEAIKDLRETRDIKIYYASVYDGFSGHEAYSDDNYINEITPRSNDTEDIDVTEIISASSMHPNDKGAQVYADAIQAVIDRCEADRTAHFEKLRMPDEAKLGNGREYKGLVEGFVKEHGEPKKTVDNFSGFEGTFCRLIDFNRDGVTELFIAAQDASAYVYTLKDGDIEELHWDVLRDEPIGKEYDMNTVINYGFAVNIGISADPYEVASANYKKICRS